MVGFVYGNQTAKESTLPLRRRAHSYQLCDEAQCGHWGDTMQQGRNRSGVVGVCWRWRWRGYCICSSTEIIDEMQLPRSQAYDHEQVIKCVGHLCCGWNAILQGCPACCMIYPSKAAELLPSTSVYSKTWRNHLGDLTTCKPQQWGLWTDPRWILTSTIKPLQDEQRLITGWRTSSVNTNASKWHLQKMGNEAKGMFEYHQTEDCYYATYHHQEVQIFAFVH